MPTPPANTSSSARPDANGLLFDGTIAGVGTSYAVNYPSAATTSVYGPDNLGGGDVATRGQLQERRCFAPPPSP